MSDKFILFNERMVEAIQDGVKTQTRRVIKTPSHIDQNHFTIFGADYYPSSTFVHWPFDDAVEERMPPCSYGKPGDRLLVRERCQIYGHWVRNGVTRTGRQRWRFSTHASHQVRYAGDFVAQPKDREELGFWNRPSIFMPRWAVRIVLEIVEVCAQRLQEISEEDAKAEGVESYIKTLHPVEQARGVLSTRYYTSHFSRLWDSINAERGYGWDSNCWVWAITFKLSQ